MLEWKIWYSSGETYSNEDGSWRNAPIYGVVIVAVRDLTEQRGTFYYSGFYPGAKAGSGNKFYVKRVGMEPWAVDEFGLIQLVGAPDVCPLDVKIGEMVSQERWHEIQNLAVADTGFPRSWIRRRCTDPNP